MGSMHRLPFDRSLRVLFNTPEERVLPWVPHGPPPGRVRHQQILGTKYQPPRCNSIPSFWVMETKVWVCLTL